MKVLIASTEVHPFIKVGGLADVTGALSKALKKRGIDVRVILPKYKGIEEKGFPIEYKDWKISCQISSNLVEAEIVESQYDGIITYLVEKDEYFFREYVYGTPEGDYLDNAERFIFFSKSIIEAAKITSFLPNVIHCNDWETALVPLFLKTIYAKDPVLRNIASLLTIHNIGYQGNFWRHDMHLLNVGWEFFSPEYLEFYGMINFLKGGIIFSDVLNTVSKKYREEIQTEEFGYGLHEVVRMRKDDLYAVLNGIDYDEWNPETDPFIPERYGVEEVEKKSVSKHALRERLKLRKDWEGPLFGTISRLTEQKGIDLISMAIPEIISFGAQYVILGNGETRYENVLTDLAEQFKGSFSFIVGYNEELAHLIEAGCDAYLMPSKYEPCGLNQLYSLRYGTVPVVRAVGGLDDTVRDYASDPDRGTGFKFYEYSKEAFLHAIKKAIELYKNQSAWKELAKRCMREDFSWDRSAHEYEELYKKAIEKHAGH